MQAHPSDATGVRTPERNAIAAIRDAYEAARAAGFDTNDVVEVIAAARGDLPDASAVYSAAHKLARAATYLNAPVGTRDGFRRPLDGERGWATFPLPRLDECGWSAERPEETSSMLVIEVPVKRGPSFYDHVDYYEQHVRDAVTAHVARFGPVRALAEAPDVQVPAGVEYGDPFAVSCARSRAFWAAMTDRDDLRDVCRALDAGATVRRAA
jgi:hypothetical protein